MEETTPPPFADAAPQDAAPEVHTDTPMYGSTASGSTEAPAAPALRFLERTPVSFWAESEAATASLSELKMKN